MSAQFHVLVVDNSREERQRTANFLKKEAYMVSEAASPEIATLLLETYNRSNGLRSIRLIILENNLEEKDGIRDVLPLNDFRVKAQVIILSRDPFPRSRVEDAQRRGVYNILRKEGSLDELKRAIHSLFPIR